MVRWLGMALALGMALFPTQAEAHRKRTDPCGCHHQYGLRHCHMKLKTERCEAPVSTTEAPKTQTAEGRGAAVPDEAPPPAQAEVPPPPAPVQKL